MVGISKFMIPTIFGSICGNSNKIPYKTAIKIGGNQAPKIRLLYPSIFPLKFQCTGTWLGKFIKNKPPIS